jgi:hypothetical protein
VTDIPLTCANKDNIEEWRHERPAGRRRGRPEQGESPSHTAEVGATLVRVDRGRRRVALGLVGEG